MRGHLLTACCYALMALSLRAAETPSGTITFSITSAEMDSITKPLILNVRLQADPTSDLIYKVNLRVPSELAEGRGLPGAVDGRPVVVSPAMFSDYKKKDIEAGLPAMTTSPFSLSTLFYRSQPVTASLWLTYCVRDEPEQSTEEVTFAVTPRGPVAGVVLGGILGVFAVIIFRSAYQLARYASAVMTRTYLLRAASSATLGVIVVTIIVLILRTNPAQLDKLPVTIDVKDAWGGFVIGLFFQPLAHYLAKRSWSNTEKPETPEGTEATA